MKKLLIGLILTIPLFSCATYIPYDPSPNITVDTATKTIERVISEQPKKYVPKGVVVNVDYMIISEGSMAKTKGNVYVLPINQRIYFDSILDPLLYKKRYWYIVQIQSENGRLIRNIYTENEEKAKRFIDALAFFKNRAQ